MVISNFKLILCQFLWNCKGKAEQQLPFLAFACYFFQFPDHMIYYHYPIILIISCNWWVLEYHIRLSTVLKWKYAIRPVTCSRYVTSSKSHRVNFKWCESIFCNAITNPNSELLKRIWWEHSSQNEHIFRDILCLKDKNLAYTFINVLKSYVTKMS